MVQEALALDVVRDPVSDLGGRLDRYAGDLSARFDDFGVAQAARGPSLMRDLDHRWALPTAAPGLIEVFDGRDFSGLMRHWGERAGYQSSEYDFDSPFVIPVDPVEHVQGLTGRQLRRPPRRRDALRPVTVRSQRPTARPQARERWRAIEAFTPSLFADADLPGDPTPTAAPRLSAYPAAMGRAGAIDANLLRFPTATAQIASGEARAVVVDDAGARQGWSNAPRLTPAAHAAERLADEVGDRLAPSAAEGIDAWLVPADSPLTARDSAARTAVARARRRLDRRTPLISRPSLRGFTPTLGRFAPEPEVGAPVARRWDAETPGALVEPVSTPDGGARDGGVDGRRAVPGAERGAIRSAAASVPERAPGAEASVGERAAASMVGGSRSNLPAAVARAFASGDTAEPTSTTPGTIAADAPWLPVASAARAAPWSPAASAPPGRPTFVPAALAQLARQIGGAARPSATPAAAWPWAPPPVAPAFDFARRADDGVLLNAAVAPAAPDDASTGLSPAGRVVQTPPESAEQPRPPGQVTATTSIQPAARPPLDPEASLAVLLGGTRDAGEWQAVRQAVAASPALAQAVARLDRLQPRAAVGLPSSADAPVAPPDPTQGLAPIGLAPVASGPFTSGPFTSGPFTSGPFASAGFAPLASTERLLDGLAVLTGAPAASAVFADAWQAAPPLVRALLAASGMAPGHGDRPSAAFSMGERLAAVATDLSSRHGLTVASGPSAALDAPWFSEPTGTLVVPMAATAGDEEATAFPGRPARRQTPAQRAAVDTATPPPPDAASSQPRVERRPPALGAALRGAERFARQTRASAPRLRPVPRLSRLTAPIAPEALSLLDATRNAPPALVGILARAERLLTAGAGPEATVAALARAADLPTLVSLARLADAPDAIAALSDPTRAPQVLRALQRVAARPHAEPRAMQIADSIGLAASDPTFVEPVADRPSPAADLPARGTPSGAVSGADAQAEQMIAALTGAIPAAVQAALRALAPAGADASGRNVSATPGAMGRETAAAAAPERPAIGAFAQRVTEWAQIAEAARPARFDQIALSNADATQSPIAQRVITPRWGVALDPTLVQPQAGRPAGAGAAERATPIGRIGRRSAALTTLIDGLGPTPSARGSDRMSPAGARRAAWAPVGESALVQRVAAIDAPDVTGDARRRAPLASVAAGGLAPTRARAGFERLTEPQTLLQSAAGSASAAGLPSAGATATGFASRAGEASAATRPAGPTPVIAPGLSAGRFRWPQVALAWVQSAANEPAPAAQPGAGRSRPSVFADPAGARATAPGVASLAAHTLSSRILSRRFDGLGLLSAPFVAPTTGPLGPVDAGSPTLQLALGLPERDEAPASPAEAFADRTLARQVPLRAPGGEARPASPSARFDLDVDWVQPLQAVDAADADLAPRLRSPSNIRRAIGVWVDAVKAEAERSPAAARQALGSVGQLIEQFSAPSSASTTVRPSNVLRGPIFGEAGSPVTLTAPTDGEARPTLIRPGEQAAKQALRKGNNETMQVSGGAQTVEESRHKNAEQTDELIPPEEVERLAAEVIDRIKRELEFDLARTGEDGWD